MADIKTRDVVKGTIKTIDKATIASERMKSVSSKTKDNVEHMSPDDENSSTEYAINRVTNGTEGLSKKSAYQFKRQGQKSLHQSKENIAKIKNKVSDIKSKRAPKNIKAISTQGGSQIQDGIVSRYTVSSIHNTQVRYQNARIRKSHYKTSGNIKTIKKYSVKTSTKAIKTAQATSKVPIKTVQQVTKAPYATVRATQKPIKATKNTTYIMKTTAKAPATAIKAIIKGTRALFAAIAAGCWIAVVIVLVVVLLGSALSMFGSGGGNTNSYIPVSAEVEAYEPLIQKYAHKHNISEYVELIKAVMMQESGGRGNDPMQASECGYNTKYPNSPNGITNAEYSINVGIQNLAACLKAAKVKNPIDMERIKLALQGYNFGNGYIAWAIKKYNGYSAANAIEFSNMMAKKNGWSSYGDTQYVPHVLRYYPYGREFIGGGNQTIVKIALSQVGNVGGKPYWSWYGFNGRVEWCACFVSWCANEAGHIDAGVIPKFASCVIGSQWFKDRGQWKGRNYVPMPGDIIFFDWQGDGSTDHVGIVERVENGTVYTVEGNSRDACKQRNYSIGHSSIYGYGIPSY